MLEKRPIAALSRQRAADLLAGRGAGYALAAELNHYPGPMHVRELADELALTTAQRRTVRALERAMHRTARPLGRRLVALEGELDRAFRSGAATSTRVTALTRRIAALDGRLRLAHLDAHVRTRALLSAEQVARYDRLRGYGPAHPREHSAGHGHGR